MTIPQRSRRHVRRAAAYCVNEFGQDESLRSHASRHLTSRTKSSNSSSVFEHSDDDENDDEDDPALYQNLAYFRSQSSRKAACHRGVRSRSSSPSPPPSSHSDEDIFDMEL
ncbi:hypothetical protein PybrP1_008877 [[Pythium] brassicae (nom. inval.)]|nr:hypothetical protein PybrP1_008877 [[Pythium] brassicae (nom. inval.)]